MSGDTADRILSALRERYPCAEVPTGTWKKLGQEFGVSGEWVRQVATNAGWTRHNGLKPPKVFACQCGAPVGKQAGICDDCRWVTLECAACGSTVRRRVSEMVWKRTVSARYTGRVFCDRQCYARFQAGRPRGPSEGYALVVPCRANLDAEVTATLTALGVEIVTLESADLSTALPPRHLLVVLAFVDPANPADRELISQIAASTDASLIAVHPDDGDTADALDAGADACVRQSDPATLAAQVRAAVRRAGLARPSELPDYTDDSFTIGNVRIELNPLTVTVGDQPVQLTPAEFRIFATLARHAGTALSHSELMAQASGRSSAPHGSAGTVKVHVGRIRRKLTAAGATIQIVSRVRFGYMLTGSTAPDLGSRGSTGSP